MARRQDSGSNSSPGNQRPSAHDEDRLPEFNEETRGRGEDDDEFEEVDEEDVEAEEEDEGSI